MSTPEIKQAVERLMEFAKEQDKIAAWFGDDDPQSIGTDLRLVLSRLEELEKATKP